ncbi:Extracellular serine proteinase precursor [Streptomyces sp. ADI96-02]|uniref:S8 family peptidase n=1 Tax=unclassified Streptomyces TaxID=2593676 RepID=UPI000F55901B|nr:S8 family peptidase [Streptomyces sp. ADI96-02]RPK69216.1 Extracellular serine proteinase precursor [Streptomyces sp. ADI96-02]
MSMRPTNRKMRTAAITGALAAACAGGLAAAPAQAASGEGGEGGSVATNSSTPIPGSYIVTLERGAGFKASSATGEDLIEKYGGTVERTFDTALNGYSANLSAAEAERVAADPAVAAVEQDQRVSLSNVTQPDAPWGLDRIDQTALPLDTTYTYPAGAGSGVTVYVIDTGVRTTHQEISGRAAHGFDAIDGDAIADDGNGHGTHVATTIAGSTYGVAKKANVVSVRVLDNQGGGTISGVIAGVDWTTKNRSGPSVANLSLGGSASNALDTAVRNSIGNGVTYAVAAGNNSDDAYYYSPARVQEAITVGATTNTDAKADWSNYGPEVDLFAPGASITAGWNTSDTATAIASGTSMAAPHVAGAAAVHLSNKPTATPAQIADALTYGATPGVVTNPGPGSPDRLLKLTP